MNQVYMKIYWPSSHSVFIDKKFLSYRIRIRGILESLKEWILTSFILVFLAAYFIPFNHLRVQDALLEAFHLLQEYAREHVLFCLIPAFFIAGAITVFISHASIIKY